MKSLAVFRPYLPTLPRQEHGQGLVEYALILSLVALLVITVLTAIGEQTAAIFEDVLCTLESGKDCQCEVNEQFLKYPSYSCTGGIFAFQTLTTCRDKTSLSLLIQGVGEIGLTYDPDKQVFYVAMADPGGLCDALASGSPPIAYIISRHNSDGSVRTLPFSFGGSGSGGSGGGGGEDDGSGGGIPVGVNHAPVLAPIGYQDVEEGQVVTLPIAASDMDDDPLTLDVWETASFIDFSDHHDGTGILTIAPGFADNGYYTVLAMVSDGRGGTDSEVFVVTVKNYAANHEPELTPLEDQSVDEGTTQDITIFAYDPDGDDLIFTSPDLQDFMTLTKISPATARLTVTPDYTDSGTYPVTIKVNDAGNINDSITFNVVVNEVNRDPVITPIDNHMMDEGTVHTLTISALDPDGDPITLVATGLETFMTFVDAGDGSGTLTLEPDLESAGSYSVIMNANDDRGGSAYITLLVVVNDVAIVERVVDDLEILFYFDNVTGSTISADSGAAAPLTLYLSDTSAVSTVANGMRVHTPTYIQTGGAASTLASHIKATNEITVEAWVKPDNLTQNGPARIVSLSWSIIYRNVSLTQDGSRYEIRLRTTTAGLNGTDIRLQTDYGTVTTNLAHLVYTRSADGTATFYINGSPIKTITVDGNFSNWSTDHPFMIANEQYSTPVTDRDWLGEYYLVAMYSRALTADEVLQNYNAGGAWVP